MAASHIPVSSEAGAEKLQSFKNTIGGQDVHSEAVTPVDESGAAFTTSNRFPVTTGDVLQKYRISDKVNDLSTNINYFGFLAADSNWYIMKEDLASSPNTYRYARGDSGYSTAWTDRATQSYDYISAYTWP